MSALQHLNAFPLNKADIARAASRVIDAVVGGLDVEELAVRLKAAETMIEMVRKSPEFVQALEERLERYPSGQLQFGAASIRVLTRTEWDYSHSPEWVRLKAAEDMARAQRLAHEEAMRALPEEVASTSTGEVLHPARKRKVLSYPTISLDPGAAV